jgi:hypothetical protein
VVEDAFKQKLNVLLDELISTAANGDSRKKFAEKSVKVIDKPSSNETIYGLVQCTPDLTKQDCSTCLDSVSHGLSNFCGDMKGCLYLGPSCSIRYDIIPFFKSIRGVKNKDSPAPQPQPSETNANALPPTTVKGISIMIQHISFICENILSFYFCHRLSYKIVHDDPF